MKTETYRLGRTKLHFYEIPAPRKLVIPFEIEFYKNDIIVWIFRRNAA